MSNYKVIYFPEDHPIIIKNQEQYEIAKEAIKYPNILKLNSKHIRNIKGAIESYNYVKGLIQ